MQKNVGEEDFADLDHCFADRAQKQSWIVVSQSRSLETKIVSLRCWHLVIIKSDTDAK